MLVRPKAGILDPQGDAVERALEHLGFSVSGARVGKVVDLDVEAADEASARAQVERMCEQLLANPLIESYEIELQWLARSRGSASSRIPGRRTTGTRCGRSPRSTRRRCRCGTRSPSCPSLDAVVLPGGFSYGDYLRCGAIARFSPATAAVCAFAESGGLVLGICNGFQVLCEAGLLPGALLRNESLRFVCRDVALRVERADTPFTARCSDGQTLVIPVKHGDGRYVPPPDLDPAQVVFRYRDNPNGSVDDIAGVCNEAGNVLGLMPHPEHAVDPLLGSADGAFILASLVDAARDRALATV